MAVVLYIGYIFRFVDFSDTVFFVLRKKATHISTLQVTHHFIMPLYGWVVMTWAPGGHETFGGMLNTFIHAVMYSYYFIAALGPEYRKYIWWKKHLTKLQILQFVSVLVKSFVVATGSVDCGYPWQAG